MASVLEITDVTHYAARCKAELGLPDVPLAPMNCLEGVEIPVTLHGQRPTADEYEAMREGALGCDNPSWIGDGDPCANYSFIHTRQLSDDVVAVLFCRQRALHSPATLGERLEAYDAEPSAERFRDLYNFDTLGLIWTNTETGATCFFDRVADTYGGYVIMPDDPGLPSREALPSPTPPEEVPDSYWALDARSLWKPPVTIATQDLCVNCHSTGPFIRAGHIRALDIVPSIGADVPYQLVGEVGRSQASLAPPRAVSTTPIAGPAGDEPQLCTTCHRIGLGESCDRFSQYYAGQTDPPGQAQDLPFHERVLMPPPMEESPLDSAAWAARYQRHLDKLACCCETPSALGCTVQDITQSPLPAPVPGTGPDTCEL